MQSSVCFYVGFIFLVNFAFQALQSLYILWIGKACKIDFPSTYGPGSYAFVTGATDGVGKQYLFALCRRGLNLIMVGRSADKIEKVKQEIASQFPKTKVISLLCDFAKAGEKGFFEASFAQIKDLDVSIVVNNVGMFYPFASRSDANLADKKVDKIVEVIFVNLLSYVMNHLHFEPKFNKRKHKSAFIDLSSVMAFRTFPLAELYISSKCFNAYFCKSRAFSNKNSRIDYLCYYLAKTETKIIDSVNTVFNVTEPKSLSPEEAAELTFRGVGRTLTFYGHPFHMASAMFWKFVQVFDRTWLKRKFFKPVIKN